MGRDVELACRCGEIHGWLRDASPRTVNRVLCYCDDCQAFLHHLGRSELLDRNGGSDIVQLAPSSIAFDRGTDRIVALRFSPKGPYRFHASCCKTPLGNTVRPSIPFVGVVAELFKDVPDAGARDAVFGPPIGAIFGKYATGDVPGAAPKMGFGLMVRSAGKIFGWKLRGQTWPHPYFERGAPEPRYPVTLVTRAERDAARARCGPKPA
jgi:hypothetical protein